MARCSWVRHGLVGFVLAGSVCYVKVRQTWCGSFWFGRVSFGSLGKSYFVAAGYGLVRRVMAWQSSFGLVWRGKVLYGEFCLGSLGKLMLSVIKSVHQE